MNPTKRFAKKPFPRSRTLFKSVLLAVFCLFSVMGKEAASQVDKPYFTDIGQFNYARFLMDEREYRVAAREFSRLIENFPASPLIPEAQFNLSEAYLHAGRYNEAVVEFKLFLNNFKDSPFALVAEVRIREAEEKLRDSRTERSRLPVLRDIRPAMRAVQVMFFEGRNRGEVDAELKRLKRAGIDTVIVRAFHNYNDRYYPLARHGSQRGVYFRTALAPVVDDILPALADLAHGNGLKIFAWMTTRYADYGVEGDNGLACRGYDMSTRRFYRCKGLDLFNGEAVKRLEAIYSDLADNDIDGVLFQDDLVLRHNEGFGPAAEALYGKDAVGRLDPESLYLRSETDPGKVHYTRLFWRWSSVKNRQLLSVAERLRTVVKRKRPQARFAINLMYESLTNPPYALAWLSQDLSEALKKDFDYYSVMAYHRQMGEELNKEPGDIRAMIARMVKDATDAVGDAHRVLIKLQTVDWRTGDSLSNGEVVGLIRDIEGLRDVSLAVVPYRGDFPFKELGVKKDLAALN
ncbi:MAG: tetratricopeptide repeat protein [Deltaproteobacteria bacterium]|nr:tetratricopeptide repeat protein [Deltaproteobacteria bacterium]